MKLFVLQINAALRVWRLFKLSIKWIYQVEADLGWFRGIVSGVVELQKELDPMINDALPSDWPLSRIDTLLRAVMRSGAFELLKRKDVPAKVVINEYLDVAKAFFEEDEPRLVNGVLNRIARKLREDEFPTK